MRPCTAHSLLGTRPTPALVGFARLVTDAVTFAYLTDVYVLPPHQGKGLGTWLVECVQATLDTWPMLRRTMLLTTSARSVEFYRKTMDMDVFDNARPDAVKAMGGKGLGSSFRDDDEGIRERERR